MADVKPRVFISAVTGEFETARNAVAADLRSRGCDVTIQSDFNQGPDSVTLLKSLYDYIRDCHAVVCIIGKRTGACPPKAAAERFKDMLPAGIEEASYTQWEYFFARHFNRRIYIYVANDDWRPDKVAASDDRQTAFTQFLKDRGDHRTAFSNVDQLARAVLKEEFSAKAVTTPPPTGKPIILPYPSIGPLFKGREGFMRQLHDSLSGKGKTAITSKALYGLGGVGKTRVAVEYAWAHREDYTALLFVVADTPEALRRNLATFATTLMPGLDTTDDNIRMQTVLDWLAANSGWFLILDNVDTKEALAEADALLAKLSGGHLVVTSRLADFSANFEPLALDVLTVDDAATFLLDRTKGRRRSANDDDARAREIAVELDGLALALEQAGAYIAKHKLTFDGYLERWRSAQHDNVLNWFDKQTMTAYPRAVAVTWQTSVTQLTEPGRRLLERLAWLAPEPVPEFLLDVPIPGAEAADLREALADVAAYSLVTQDMDRPYFLVHRLVQDVTRRSLLHEMSQRSLAEALNWILETFPSDADDVRSWPKAEPLAPHARSVITFGDQAGIKHLTAGLMNRLGMLLFSKGLYAEAEPLLQSSLAIMETSVPDHPLISIPVNSLAALYLAQGRYAEAEPLHRRALAISEKALGSEHPMVGTLINNLAQLLQAQGRYAEAEPLYLRDLAISQNALGPNHVSFATSLNNLAGLYQTQGRYSEAEPLFQRSLAIREKALGSEHPDVGNSLNNLAELYRLETRHAEAEPLHRRAIAIFEKALGIDHPDLATSLNNLGLLYYAQHRYADAEPLYRRSIGIRQKALGPDHPSVGTSFNNLALIYHAQRRYAEAESFYKRDLAIGEKSLGPNHADVAATLHNLAALYRDQRRYLDAVPFARRCIRILTSISGNIGREHPNLAVAIANYYSLLAATGRSKKKIKMDIEKLLSDEK